MCIYAAVNQVSYLQEKFRNIRQIKSHMVGMISCCATRSRMAAHIFSSFGFWLSEQNDLLFFPHPLTLALDDNQGWVNWDEIGLATYFWCFVNLFNILHDPCSK